MSPASRQPSPRRGFSAQPGTGSGDFRQHLCFTWLSLSHYSPGGLLEAFVSLYANQSLQLVSSYCIPDLELTAYRTSQESQEVGLLPADL